MTLEPRWQKLRPPTTIGARLDLAPGDLDHARGVDLPPVRHPPGRMTAGSRRPDSSAPLVPSHDPSDLDRRGDHLGIPDGSAPQRCHQFPFPDAVRPVAATVPGAP